MKKWQKIWLTSSTTFSLISLLIFSLILAGVDIRILNKAIISSQDYNYYKELREIIHYRTMIENKYYVQTDPQSIKFGAIRGMFDSLPDGYSRYYTKEELEEKNRRDDGESIGIGVQIQRTKNKEFIVVHVEAGRPAEAAGIEIGDQIVSVNDIPISDENYKEVLSSLRSDSKEYGFFGKYTKAKIIVLREGKEMEFLVDRDVHTDVSVNSQLMGDIGYIQIKYFINTTYEDYTKALQEFHKQGIHKLIIDLRDNPGGLVNEARKIAGTLVGKQNIYFTHSRLEEMKEHPSEIDKKYDFDVILLVNEYSASSSELLSGALKDYGAATLVGTTTFGKGIIQTTYTNMGGDGYQITTNEYLTPKKNTIHKIGIKPDHEAESGKELELAKELLNKNATK